MKHDILIKYKPEISKARKAELIPEIQALIKVLHSDEIKNFINEKYKGAVVPAF